MAKEGQQFERKSLRVVIGNSADWHELARDCVSFALSSGAVLAIGIEDGQQTPPKGQVVPADLPDTLRKRIAQLTHNVTVAPSIETLGEGQYLKVVVPRSAGIPSTTDGRYFRREGDERRPVVGEEVISLLADRPSFNWETQLSEVETPDAAKTGRFVREIRASDRVKPFVKEKNDAEILEHYQLRKGGRLTNLGLLCIGSADNRAQLGTAPIVQAIKFDEQGQKIWKSVWDDYTLTPMELMDAVWDSVPDFREEYEIPNGLFRDHVPAYAEAVVRELVVNALVHRPYTQRGDIFLNLYPDRLEVVNPGSLPVGVTPHNILHASVRRNEGLARVFHDLKRMEREGSGYDMIYDVLLSQGRGVPKTVEGPGRVEVTVERRIVDMSVIDLLARAAGEYPLSQKERIVLGLVAQHKSVRAVDLADMLALEEGERLRSWTARLVNWKILQTSGQTRGQKFHLAPGLGESRRTTLDTIEPHRLEALIVEDIRRYPGSSISEISQRVAPELPYKQMKGAVDRLIARGELSPKGERRHRRYHPG